MCRAAAPRREGTRDALHTIAVTHECGGAGSIVDPCVPRHNHRDRYALYGVVLRLPFFPFLNLVAVFIVIGIGADDVFVLVDQWKQAFKFETRVLEKRCIGS